MLFGHNSNVQVGEATFHVQTEDRGVTTALIDTTVYFGGRVMHRRTNNYHDLIPLNPDREGALQLRLDEQHRSTLEDIRSGALHLAPPQPRASGRKPDPTAKPSAAETRGDAMANGVSLPTTTPAPGKSLGTIPPATIAAGTAPVSILKLDLRNPRSWLAGKQARLEVVVMDASGKPQAGATVTARIEGAASPENFSSQTGESGTAEIVFVMPRLASGEAALVIEAVRHQMHGDPNSAARGRLRFALRSKPRTT